MERTIFSILAASRASAEAGKSLLPLWLSMLDMEPLERVIVGNCGRCGGEVTGVKVTSVSSPLSRCLMIKAREGRLELEDPEEVAFGNRTALLLDTEPSETQLFDRLSLPNFGPPPVCYKTT